MEDIRDPTDEEKTIFAGDTTAVPEKVGTMVVRYKDAGTGKVKKMFNRNALYIPGFHTNVVSGHLLLEQKLWNHGWENTVYYGPPGKQTAICKLLQKYR